MMKETLVALIGLVAVAAGADVTVEPGTTLDWAKTPPGESEQILCAGGAIVYSGAEDLVITNVFSLSAKTTFSCTGAGRVRFARKFLKTAEQGQLVLNASATFGSDDDGIAAFLPENAVAFSSDAPGDAALTLTGFLSCTVRPEKWSSPAPIRWNSGAHVNLYGADMFDVTDGVVTLPALDEDKEINWRITNPANLGGATAVNVPSNVTAILRRMDFDATTCSGSAWTKEEQFWSQDFSVARGGTLEFFNGSTLKLTGKILGEGRLLAEKGSGFDYLFGSVTEMSETAILQLDSRTDYAVSKGNNCLTRLASSFPGKVIMGASTPTNIVSIGFCPSDFKYETNSVYRLGAVDGGSANFYPGNRGDVAGARIQYNKRQKIIIGTLSGLVNVAASSEANSCDLEIEDLNGAQIYVKNGLRIRILATRGYPSIYYSSTQVAATTNAITLVDGGNITLIELPGAGQTVYLHAEGNAQCVVGAVTGTGTLVVDGGSVRVGRTEKTARVEVRNGARVTLGGGADLGDLLGAKPALWLDAAATNAMVGAWNEGWAKSTASGGGESVLKTCPAITFNGASSATWTNGFPLIEKWFDHRPSQRLNYGWQDRNVNYQSTLYTLVYPYLVPGGLNGRPYMSFGIHGTTNLDPSKYGLADLQANDPTNYRRERRRMPLMQDMRTDDPTKPEGHAIPVQTAILVFGSQNGGGRAILGGYKDNGTSAAESANGRAGWIDKTHNPSTGNNYGRTGASSCYAATNGIFATSYETYIDNVGVDAPTTGLNGGWQVISVNGGGAYFRSLGMSTRFAYAGGQNYAELLVYTNKLTTVERRTVESYLALKWNLPNVLAIQGPVDVAAGASVDGQALGVTGAGVWRIDSPDAAPTLDGTFAGLIEIPLTLQDGKIQSDVRLNGTAGSAKGRINLTLAAKPKCGTYPLVTGSAAAAMPWSLAVVGETYARTCLLKATSAGPALEVRSIGTVILVK